MFWIFVTLLAVHWFADFVCQTHWQASNKSKSIEALLRHVGVYTSIIFLAVGVMVWSRVLPSPDNDYRAITFVIVNGVAHFMTDYVTSRLSSIHFALAMKDIQAAKSFREVYGRDLTPTDLFTMDIDPGRHFHNFFVVIGLDQLIHQVTLAATLYLFLS